ncbi:MAG: PLP-dependent aminotransferase family protein [Ruminococcus sp.]|nr:PLP-dependent aminotransferase family protein [Ruminococcus sp.]
MLYDFIIIDKNKKTPLYRQIYMSVRSSIENGSLKKGTKMPSIRRLSADLNVSKITVTGAYEQLCAEGYITNKPQSGYYVEAEFENKPKAFETDFNKSDDKNFYYEYDFSGKSIDEKIININEWKKCVKEILNQNFLLSSYGDEQGEKALRNALVKYSFGTRSVNTTADNIIVGGGTQPLLYILCSLIGRNKRIAMADSSYVQSEFVFRSFGYNINYFESDRYGVTINSLEKIKPDIILINPNFVNKSGANMPVTRRIEIIDWAKNNDALIIEDDYNGELRYSTHPVPCVQNYNSENTIYLGSFSKVLLPSVRISYMVLPQKYLKLYTKIKKTTNQTASKTEQLALAKYISNGKIDVHLRKARRIYFEKSKIILKSIEKSFYDSTEMIFNETSLYISLKINKKLDRKKIEDALKKNSISIMPYKIENNEFGISFSGISQEKIEEGIKILSEVIFDNII